MPRSEYQNSILGRLETDNISMILKGDHVNSLSQVHIEVDLRIPGSSFTIFLSRPNLVKLDCELKNDKYEDCMFNTHLLVLKENHSPKLQ